MVAYGYSEAYGAKGLVNQPEFTGSLRVMRREGVVVVKLCRERTTFLFSLFSLLRVSIDLFGR